MIDIKDISGKVIASVGFDEGAKGCFSLMSEDYVSLPFSLPEPIDFRVGTYVDLRGVFDDALGGKLAKVYQVVEIQRLLYGVEAKETQVYPGGWGQGGLLLLDRPPGCPSWRILA